MPTELPLILASRSPQRGELLRRAGYVFKVRPSAVVEPPFAGFASPEAYVQHLAWLKAADVARSLDRGVVLAADTVGMVDGIVLGKPVDRADAARMLAQLAGRVHHCLTGVALWRKPEDYFLGAVVATMLRMKELTPAELEGYLESRQWEGKAGAYGIQLDDPLVEILEGSFSNVVGLPLERLAELLAVIKDEPANIM